MHKMNVKETTFKFPVISDYLVHVEVTTDLEKSLTRHEETKNVEADEATGAMAVHIRNQAESFMFLPHNASPGMIAHESWNVIRNMMVWSRIEIDNETVSYPFRS